MYTPPTSQEQIDVAVEIIDNLAVVGIYVCRRNRSIETNRELPNCLKFVLRRHWNGLMFVLRCVEETERVLARFSPTQIHHTSIRVAAYQRRALADERSS